MYNKIKSTMQAIMILLWKDKLFVILLVLKYLQIFKMKSTSTCAWLYFRFKRHFYFNKIVFLKTNTCIAGIAKPDV